MGIKRKEFYLLSDDDGSHNVKISDRINKMIHRGWKMVNTPRDISAKN